MSQDRNRNPYYDSARDKPDRSEFASLRADLEGSRRRAPPPSGGLSVGKLMIGLALLVVAIVVARRFLF